jgi:putative NIF3 family GTP cyclohydrolase 1 type 2
VAQRDAILEYAAELLDLDAYPDYGPMGLQVEGTDEVTRIACGVSASLALFERAAELGAQLLIVHHGLFWDNESRRVDRVMRGRLQALFDADLTLAAYHLALDAHPELGNNALLAKELGIEPKERFAGIGFGGPLRPPTEAQRSPAASARSSGASRWSFRTDQRPSSEQPSSRAAAGVTSRRRPRPATTCS